MSEQYDTNQSVDFTSDLDDLDAATQDQSVLVQTEEVAQRQRKITAKIQIPRSVEQVWQVLTDYEALADFIPNLASCQRLEHPTGGIRLEQVGSQRLLRFNFSARVVLDLQEKFPHEILFDMVEGDLKAYSGKWVLEPLASEQGTNLCYTVLVHPKLTMPVALIERRLSNDLRTNLLAIRQQVQKLFVNT